VNTYSLLEFLRAAGKLKTVRRQGWVDRGLPDAESVADHTFRAMVMAWVLGREAGVDVNQLLRLLLLHDLPEVEAGDATPYGNVLSAGDELAQLVPRWRELVSPEQLAAGRRQKRRTEEQAVGQLAAGLPDALADELRELWLDYTERRTPEARFAAQIDKLEAALQAVEYRNAGRNADVENFLATAREAVKHPVLLALLAEIEAAAQAPKPSDPRF
jgi:putative hydrolase of HD superfamily